MHFPSLLTVVLASAWTAAAYATPVDNHHVKRAEASPVPCTYTCAGTIVSGGLTLPLIMRSPLDPASPDGAGTCSYGDDNGNFGSTTTTETCPVGRKRQVKRLSRAEKIIAAAQFNPKKKARSTVARK